MQYHIVPTEPSRKIGNDTSLSIDIKNLAKKHNALLIDALHKVKKNVPICRDLFYLFDNNSMRDLRKLLRENDEIVIHGEGLPYVIGLEEASKYDLYPLTLATLIAERGFPDLRITIKLLSCNSATDCAHPIRRSTIFNFANDLSLALHYVGGYKNILVEGYTGYIIDKGSVEKYSVSDTKDTISSKNRLISKNKGVHCTLDEARQVYENGNLISNAKKNLKVNCSKLQEYMEVAFEDYITIEKAMNNNKMNELEPDAELVSPYKMTPY